MRYELNFEAEPFEASSATGYEPLHESVNLTSEWDEFAEELESFESEMESPWQGEVNRRGREFMRWVQSSLNRIMGLRLAVDGMMGAQTRSAIRSFQQRARLPVDGAVGSQTEAAIRAALAGGSAPSPSIIPPDPQPADYADLAKQILRQSRPRRKRDSAEGIVLSVVQLIPADGKAMIDTQTERGAYRRRLKNPPAHVVLPAEVYEIGWKRIKLQYVWILSNEKSKFPVGGVLFLPQQGGPIFYLVTFNVGKLDDGVCTNVHHAEMQAVRWIEEQPGPWRSRLGAMNIWNLSRQTGLGYSPCNACCFDLARFLTALRGLHHVSQSRLRRASITWLTLYDKNKVCGHPTDTANLRRLQTSGWELNGPGWMQRQPKPSIIPQRVRTA